MKNLGGCDLVNYLYSAMAKFKIHEKLINVHDWP